MRIGLIPIVGIASLAACLSSEPSSVGNPSKYDPEVLALRNEVITNDSVYQAANAIFALFKKLGRARLSSLENDPNVGIALQASWEIHRRHDPSRDQEWSNLDQKELREFLDRARDRLGVELPDFWRESFLHAHLWPGLNTWFPLPGRGKLTLEVETSYGRIVANPNNTGSYPFPLKCEGKWDATVWATGKHHGNGIGSHQVTLVLRGNHVIVFGVASDAYVEEFEIATGRPVFKFCSGYVDNPPEAWEF